MWRRQEHRPSASLFAVPRLVPKLHSPSPTQSWSAQEPLHGDLGAVETGTTILVIGVEELLRFDTDGQRFG